MTRRWTRDFEELRLSDRPLVGGKCANLGELVAAGIDVPRGFAVVVDAFRAVVAGGPVAAFAASAATVDPGDAAALRALHRSATEVLRTAVLPAGLEAEVRAGYAELCARAGRADVPVAVRSSAVAEDGAAASFAGQQDTFLHVTGAGDVLARIRQCWAGLWTPQAVAYRARHSDAAAPAMAVAVQELVDAKVAGVAFTVSPTTGDPSVVAINASWGLGEAVVSGEVTPDEYWVSKVGPELVRTTVSAKARRCVPAADGRGTVIADVPAGLVSEPCLDRALVLELARLAIRVERHYGSPQDIEWALADSGPGGHRFVLLQSRPETVHAPAPRPAAPGYLSVLQSFGAAHRGAS